MLNNVRRYLGSSSKNGLINLLNDKIKKKSKSIEKKKEENKITVEDINKILEEERKENLKIIKELNSKL